MSQSSMNMGHQSPSQRGDNNITVGDKYDFGPNRIGNPGGLPCMTCEFAVRGRDGQIIGETLHGVFRALCVKAYNPSELEGVIDLRPGAIHGSKLHEVHAFMLPHTAAEGYKCSDHVNHTGRQVARVIWLTHGNTDRDMVEYAKNYDGEEPRLSN